MLCTHSNLFPKLPRDMRSRLNLSSEKPKRAKRKKETIETLLSREEKKRTAQKRPNSRQRNACYRTAMDSPSSSPCPRVLLAWNSIDGSCNVFLQIAHESNDVDHDQTATAFHFFTSIFLFGCWFVGCIVVAVVSMGAAAASMVVTTTLSERRCRVESL